MSEPVTLEQLLKGYLYSHEAREVAHRAMEIIRRIEAERDAALQQCDEACRRIYRLGLLDEKRREDRDTALASLAMTQSANDRLDDECDDLVRVLAQCCRNCDAAFDLAVEEEQRHHETAGCLALVLGCLRSSEAECSQLK